MADKSNQLVLAFYNSEADADKVVNELKQWDKASADIKLGAIGVLVKDQNGQVKTHKLGARAGGKGAKVGMILGIIAAVLSGGVTLLGGLVGGAVGGVILGSLFHQNIGLSKEDYDRIGKELNQGHAAVGVMVSPAEVESVKTKLTQLGGRTESHEVTEDADQKAAAAAESATVQPPPQAQGPEQTQPQPQSVGGSTTQTT